MVMGRIHHYSRRRIGPLSPPLFDTGLLSRGFFRWHLRIELEDFGQLQDSRPTVCCETGCLPRRVAPDNCRRPEMRGWRCAFRADQEEPPSDVGADPSVVGFDVSQRKTETICRLTQVILASDQVRRMACRRGDPGALAVLRFALFATLSA